MIQIKRRKTATVRLSEFRMHVKFHVITSLPRAKFCNNSANLTTMTVERDHLISQCRFPQVFL